MHMKSKLQTIFKKNSHIIIGAVHLPPLLGYPRFPGLQAALSHAISDLRTLEKGGADGIIFENNYDIPHTPLANPGSIVSMALVGQELRKATQLPMGVNVLWNDFRAALALAKLLGLQFIRVPVFVDDVKTQYGTMRTTPREVIQTRTSLHAEDVALFTDIQVKHAKMISKRTLFQSAQLAIKAGSDALIVTGRWTGEAPVEEQLASLRAQIHSFPILVGSGLDAKNVSQLFRHANGGIVSTSLKQGAGSNSEVNIKSYRQRIDLQKVKRLVTVGEG